MTWIGRRALLAAGATVVAALVTRKSSARDVLVEDVDLEPLSDIAKVMPAQALPPIRFLDAAGQARSLADHAGRGVVLNFWATWCGPCVDELPALDRFAGVAAGRGIDVLAVSIDRGGAPQVQAFFAAHGVRNLAVLVDPGSDAAHAAGAVGFPTTLFIDRAGKLRGKLEGPADWANGMAVVPRLLA